MIFKTLLRLMRIIKKQLYTDETIMSIALTSRNKHAHDSFITIKKQIMS